MEREIENYMDKEMKIEMERIREQKRKNDREKKI